MWSYYAFEPEGGGGLGPLQVIRPTTEPGRECAHRERSLASARAATEDHRRHTTYWCRASFDARLAARVSQRLGPTPQSGAIAIALCDSFGWSEGSTAGGYDADFDHPKDPQSGSFTLDGRRPAAWQRPVSPGSELYYVFTMSAGTPAAARFTAGSTLDVWFPFVIDSKKHYTLIVRHVVPEFEVKSSPVNNALHFRLPAFEIPQGSTAQGEIDSDD